MFYLFMKNNLKILKTSNFGSHLSGGSNVSRSTVLNHSTKLPLEKEREAQDYMRIVCMDWLIRLLVPRSNFLWSQAVVQIVDVKLNKIWKACNHFTYNCIFLINLMWLKSVFGLPKEWIDHFWATIMTFVTCHYIM